MSSLNLNEFEQYLSGHGHKFKLAQDLPLFYNKQSPSVAIWLIQGSLEVADGLKQIQVFRKSGPYYLTEMLNEVIQNGSAKVKSQSEIYLVYKTTIQEFVQQSLVHS
jgi:hypothetical protein